MTTIGIIGHGFVGHAVEYGFKHVECVNIEIYDKYKNIGLFKQIVEKSDIIFVCVPTPMNEPKKSGYGKCNTKIVKEVVRGITVTATKRKIIIIKSTIPPGTCDNLVDITGNKHAIVFNPEFLTEKSWKEDFLKQDPIVIGETKTCSEQDKKNVIQLYAHFQQSINEQYGIKPAQIITCSAKEAEMSKYALNTYFASKVIFFNELKNICDNDDIDFNKVKNIMTKDKRIGPTHMMVPGPDGLHGFGGHCFPKDTNAFLHYMYKLGMDVKKTLLARVWELNLFYREKEDWKERIGATTTNNYKHNDENKNK